MVILINGSPKRQNSTTRLLLDKTKENIYDEVFEFDITDGRSLEEKFLLIKRCRAVVLGIPSYEEEPLKEVKKFLEILFELIKEEKIKMYFLVNGSSFEGEEYRNCLENFKNLCSKTENFTYGGGVSCGGSGFLNSVPTLSWLDKKKKETGEALSKIGLAIEEGDILKEDIFTTVGISKLIYKIRGFEKK